MAGTIPLSMTQQFDIYGEPLAGGQLYIIQAGTVSTPQDAFQDLALTIKQPYPMTLDAAGRVPQFFLDNSVNSTVKIRLQDKTGVVQLAADNVLVIGPSGGGGGTVTPVDPSTVYQTGDLKARYGTGIHPGTVPGWVRANGLTIGSSTSGATMPENGTHGECQALFEYLWNTDTNLVLIPPRGTTGAHNDWLANKQLTVPDMRGRVIAGMDDMGNSYANRIGNIVLSTTLGGSNSPAGGNNQQTTLLAANLPAYTPSGGITLTIGAVTLNQSPAGSLLRGVGGGGNVGASGPFAFADVGISLNQAASTATFTGNAQGGLATPFPIVQPTMVATIYIKL